LSEEETLAVRNITATVVFALLIALCMSYGCSSSNLSVDKSDGDLNITARNNVSTMAESIFTLDEGDAIHVAGNLNNGSIDIVVTSTYSGNTIYNEKVTGEKSSIISATPGDYTVSMVANKATGTIEISD
jgi:hypothetical protein